MKLALGMFVLMIFAMSLPAQAAGDVAAGKTKFEAKCKLCHGPNGEGNPSMAKAFKTTIPPLGSKAVQDLTDAQIKKQITKGGKKMPPVTGVSDTDVTNLIAFVRSLKK